MAKQEIDISIIIPTYNRLWSLPEAIDSCRQTKCRIEIIVIDDGSTDGTWEWLQDQPGIVAVRQDNRGKCSAVNKGFGLSAGRYIRFLDSDDKIPVDANNEQFTLAKSSGCDICVSGYQLIDERGALLKSQTWILSDDFIAQQLGEVDSSHYSSYLFRRSFIEDIQHRPEFCFRDDRLFVLEAALKHPKVAVHQGYSLLHRVHPKERLQKQTGSNHRIQNNQHIGIYKEILSRLSEGGELTQRRKKAAITILAPLAHWIAKYDLDQAAGIHHWITELDPAYNFSEKGTLKSLYRYLGFKNTERLLRLRRKVLLR